MDRRLEELETEELEEYTDVSWTIILWVLAGTALGLVFDRLGLFGYLPEAAVRALAGTADTLGLLITAITVVLIDATRSRWAWFARRVSNPGKPKAITWIVGGLVGLALAFGVQALVFALTDPYGPWGVAYAFAFSNLDNAVAGVTVLLAALVNHGLRDGWRRYWHHPFFVGNAIMLGVIPAASLLIRIVTGFRPELNVQAGIEAGIMDVDSVGAALIFLAATQLFDVRVPGIDDSLQGVWRRVFPVRDR